MYLFFSVIFWINVMLISCCIFLKNFSGNLVIFNAFVKITVHLFCYSTILICAECVCMDLISNFTVIVHFWI